MMNGGFSRPVTTPPKQQPRLLRLLFPRFYGKPAKDVVPAGLAKRAPMAGGKSFK